MARQIKTGPKVLGAVVVIGGLVFGANWYLRNHGSTTSVSAVPQAQGQLADFQDTQAAQANPASFVKPSAAVATPGKTPKKVLVLPWNGELGLLLANGGPRTTQGSLMAQHGVDLTIERQDDYMKMQEQMLACANEEAKTGKSCTSGAHFVVIMGDGAPNFLTGLNDNMNKLGAEYFAKAIAPIGRSDGEDGYWAPQKVKDNPANAKGSLITGVTLDGDWNIALLFAKANNICNNPDPKTYDPECLNWVPTMSFDEADEKFNQRYCETRDVVRGNKRTGESKNVCVDSVVTWTPGDVAIAMGRGGVVPIMTTHDNPGQMAATVIGFKADYARDSELTVGMIAAALQGGNQIKTAGRPALLAAAGIAAKVFNLNDANYWAELYVGQEKLDATNVKVKLGGSKVFNAADAALYYGLNGTINVYAETYKFFGEIAVHQYPDVLPKGVLPAAQVIDVTYLSRAIAKVGVNAGVAETPKFEENAPADSHAIGNGNWSISFETGSAVILPSSEPVLNEILQMTLNARNTRLEFHGHTDNTGTPEGNNALSKARAAAVQQWLASRAPDAFPANRVKAIGHGQSQPLCSSDNSAACRATNRRVQIVLKSN